MKAGLFILAISTSLLGGSFLAHASESNGSIQSGTSQTKVCTDETCSSYGTANWKPTLNANTNGATAVAITDSGLTGWFWGDQIGWVNLQPTGAGVSINPTTGVLSGYAWSNSGSWINFSPTTVGGGTSVGVTINSSGQFVGWAWVSGFNGGWMKFDCGDSSTCITTDWRPVPDRASSGGSSNNGGNSGSSSSGSVSTSQRIVNILNTLSGPALVAYVNQNRELLLALQAQGVALPAQVIALLSPTYVPNANPGVPANIYDVIINGAFPGTPTGEEPRLEDVVPPDAVKTLSQLPKELVSLLAKFPSLAKTVLSLIGNGGLAVIDKLKNATLTLPGLATYEGPSKPGVPILSLSFEQVKALPSEVVFAKAGDFIDYRVSLAVSADGTAEQVMHTVAGGEIDLAVKPDFPASSVTGLLVVKNIQRTQAMQPVSADSLVAAPIAAFISRDLARSEPTPVQEEFVLQRFTYEDTDHNGVYTAKFTAPLVHGDYEVITLIDYVDPAHGTKELRLTTVIDPEGYVYEKSGKNETRITDAVVTLWWKNDETLSFVEWPAGDFKQVNPQRTDSTGMYSFLVPEGVYKLTVEADGYVTYEGDEFQVVQGAGVHDAIQLKKRHWWTGIFEWIGKLLGKIGL